MPNPSSPQDFKQKRKVGVVLDLPSGLSIKVKSVDLVSLVVSGKIPNGLLSTVQKHFEALGENATAEDAAKLAERMSPEELSETFSIMDNLVVAMAMDPQVYPVPENELLRDENRLYVDELSGEDKLFMFNWSQEGLKSMQRFPERPAANVDALAESESTSLAAGNFAGPPPTEL